MTSFVPIQVLFFNIVWIFFEKEAVMRIHRGRCSVPFYLAVCCNVLLCIVVGCCVSCCSVLQWEMLCTNVLDIPWNRKKVFEYTLDIHSQTSFLRALSLSCALSLSRAFSRSLSLSLSLARARSLALVLADSLFLALSLSAFVTSQTCTRHVTFETASSPPKIDRNSTAHWAHIVPIATRYVHTIACS